MVLIHHDLVTLETVGQDGMRVRGSAGSSRFGGRTLWKQLARKLRTTSLN